MISGKCTCDFHSLQAKCTSCSVSSFPSINVNLYPVDCNGPFVLQSCSRAVMQSCSPAVKLLMRHSTSRDRLHQGAHEWLGQSNSLHEWWSGAYNIKLDNERMPTTGFLLLYIRNHHTSFSLLDAIAKWRSSYSSSLCVNIIQFIFCMLHV